MRNYNLKYVLMLFIVSVLASGQILSYGTEEIEKSCDVALLKEWKIGQIIGSGFQAKVYQACDKSNNCNYALKIGSPDEAKFAEKMGNAGVGPKVYNIYECGPKKAVIMEKMEGDLNTLFYPLSKLSSTIRGTVILPQVLDLIYNAVEKGVCQNDAKLANILYKKEGDYYKLYLADYGIAKGCEQYSKGNLESAKPPIAEMLARQLGAFIYSYFKPAEYGGPAQVTISPEEKETFMHSLHAAIKWNKTWAKYLKDGAEGLPFGSYLRFVTVVDEAGKKITDVQNYTGKTTWGDVLKIVRAKQNKTAGKIIYENKEVNPAEVLPTAYAIGKNRIKATFVPE